MRRTERFRSLAEVRAERGRLKAVRDRHQEDLMAHWQLLHDPAFRRGLAGDAFGDMLRAWKPMRALGAMFRSDNGSLGNMIGLVAGSRARTLKGRLFVWALGAIVPMLLKHYATPGRLDHLATEVKHSWDRVRERMRGENAA